MENKPAEENSGDLGGLVIPTAASQEQSSGASGAGVSASAQTIQQRKTRSDVGKPRGPRGAQPATSVQHLSQGQFAALYSPEVWGRTLSAPADGLAFITGKKLWEISPEEKKALGASGSIAAQCFAVSDPKWLALSIACITVLDVYGLRFAMYLAEKKREAEEEKKKKQQ